MLHAVITEADWQNYHAIRRDILWTARDRSGYDDHHADDFLPHHHPLLLKLGERAIGTVRLDDRRDGTGVVRLVAIAADMQRLGHGRFLEQSVVAFARRLGLTKLLVNAAPDAEAFYAKTGWVQASWDPSELNGTASDCVQMQKAIGPS